LTRRLPPRASGAADSHTMSQLSVTPLQLGKRQATDTCFGIFYVVVLVAAICFAAYGGANNNMNELLNPPSICDAVPSSSTTGPPSPPPSNSTLKVLWGDVVPELPNLGFAVLFSVLFGTLWMAALRACAKPIVYGTILFKGVALVAFVLWLVAVGAPPFSIFFGIAILALYAFIIFAYRNKINLTAALIEQSVSVVSAHPQVFFAAALLLVLGALVYTACVVGAVYLLSTGSWHVVTTTTTTTSLTTTSSCEWRLDAGAGLGLAVIVFCAMWSWELFMALRFYVVSLTSGVWYFSNAALGAQEGAATDRVRYPVSTALKLAFTTSFGSIAFASLIMYICEQLRRMARQSARNNGILGIMIACCIQCIIAYIEFLTRFALTFHALTGDDFCSSARTFTDHLSRHGFSAMFVSWLARIVFQLGAWVLSLVVMAICLAIMSSTVPADADWPTWVVLGICSLVIAAFFLSFISGILLNVIDACYACLVLDLDHGARHQPQMASAIIILANPTYNVVEQPNGSYAVGYNGQQGGAQQPQVAQVVGGTPTAYATPIVHAYPNTNNQPHANAYVAR